MTEEELARVAAQVDAVARPLAFFALMWLYVHGEELTEWEEDRRQRMPPRRYTYGPFGREVVVE